MSTAQPSPPAPATDVLTDPDQPGWRRAPATETERRADAIAAAAMFAGALLSMVLWRTAGLYDDPASGPVAAGMLALVTLPLAARRRWPALVLAVVTVAFILAVTLKVPETLFLNISLFCALYTVGAWDSNRTRALWVRGSCVVVMLVWLVVELFRASTDPEAIAEFEKEGLGAAFGGAVSPLVAYLLIQVLTNVLYFAGAWLFGNVAWASARDRARTAWRTRQLVAARVHAEAQAVTIERVRIARELHDAVAHHVSVMGVQAAAARSVLERGADADLERTQAGSALEQIEESARAAIDELHGLIGTLRSPDEAKHPAEALASLDVARLPRLVDEAREAGLDAHFQVVGEPAPLSPVTSLNLYRIAQEALTNVRKHAGPAASADVRLRYLDDAIELEVSDSGTGPVRSRLARGGGLGLVGMRERVAAEGGSLHAGPRRPEGFVVRAHVPLVRAEVSHG